MPSRGSTPVFMATPDISLQKVMLWQQNSKGQPDTPMMDATYGRYGNLAYALHVEQWGPFPSPSLAAVVLSDISFPRWHPRRHEEHCSACWAPGCHGLRRIGMFDFAAQKLLFCQQVTAIGMEYASDG